MTGGEASVIRAVVRKAWLLLLCMIASSLVATTTVHAREMIGGIALECSDTVHDDGDAGQAQGDSDKAAPHHHGSCHGQFAALPSDAAMDGAFGSKARVAIADASTLRPRSVDPALRPPNT